MNLERLYEEIASYSKETHGSSNYDKETLIVRGKDPGEFAPFKYLVKKIDELTSEDQLVKSGFVFDSFDLVEVPKLKSWFEKQYGKKLGVRNAKKIMVLQLPNNKEIFDSIELVNKCYETLSNEQILMNGKNLPVRLGEWYAKSIFGLKQLKSTSQRGFDFYLQNKRVEVKIPWGNATSPKGIKLRKSLVELSQYVIIVYVGKNFMIREVCFLDSDFVLRRFAGKGHTIFLKDSDVSEYFFSKSNKHYDKVANSNVLLKYSLPSYAMKLAEHF